MAHETHLTSFDQHAKRASVGLPTSLADGLPFEDGDRLGVREDDDCVVVEAGRTRDDPGATLRETDDGTRLYLDRTVAYGAGLLAGDVELRVRSDDLTIRSLE